MTRATHAGSMLALVLGFNAQAQEPRPQEPPASDTSAAASSFRSGMIVKDSAGDTVGRITQVGRTTDGTAAVVVDVDGKPVTLAASNLSLSPAGSEAISAMTKAEIKAASARPQ